MLILFYMSVANIFSSGMAKSQELDDPLVMNTTSQMQQADLESIRATGIQCRIYTNDKTYNKVLL